MENVDHYISEWFEIDANNRVYLGMMEVRVKFSSRSKVYLKEIGISLKGRDRMEYS
jgi:hypothetical protein